MTTRRKCPECGKRRQLYAITAQEARRFGSRLTGPQPTVGTEFCAECVTNPPPGAPRNIVADLLHVVRLCQHAARDLAESPAASQIALSVASDLLRNITQTVSRTP
jgi:hypothetical protein